MATSATAVSHRSDPQPSKSHTDLDAVRSPVRSGTPPRPSLSPLSSVAKSSPPLPADITILDSDAVGDLDIGDAVDDVAALGDQPDDRSSSLSEPEDDQYDAVEQNGILHKRGILEDHVAHASLEVDSEAETERLHQTPQKLRKHPDSIGKTPSKLEQSAVADDDVSEPPSPGLAGPGAASSTSTVATTGQKRKRSDSADSSLTSAQSDLSASPRKRSHGSPAADIETEGRLAEDTAVEGELGESAEVDAEDPPEELVESPDVPSLPTKVARGRKGKPRGRLKKDPMVEAEAESTEAVEAPTQEQSEEAAARSAEELQHKEVASTAFESLRKQFAAFREKLNAQRLAKVNAELDMLNAPSCQHPEFLRQATCIDARLAKQATEMSAWYKYKIQTLRKSTLAERSQSFSQYFQTVREQREQIMYELGEDWYNLQKDWRQGTEAEDRSHIFRLPTKRSDQIRQQANYNQEISVLSGFAKYVGFPAAPDITGIEGDAAEDDLKAMKITKRVQPPANYTHTIYMPQLPDISARQNDATRQTERLAHEQFLEQTPWARPQGPIVQHGTPNLTHTPDWAVEPVAHNTKHLIRHLSSGMPHTGSPYVTPMPERRLPMDGSSSGTLVLNSDPIEPPSSVLAAPPTMERLHHAHPPLAREQGSPLLIPKHRGNGAVELPGFRNYSSISGASTIDAPPDSAEKERHVDLSASQHMFDAGPAFHDRKRPQDMFINAGFRPQEGAFAASVPLPASSGP